MHRVKSYAQASYAQASYAQASYAQVSYAQSAIIATRLKLFSVSVST
jgi:hypothetical protein